jgi:hypothetical protein
MPFHLHRLHQLPALAAELVQRTLGPRLRADPQDGVLEAPGRTLVAPPPLLLEACSNRSLVVGPEEGHARGKRSARFGGRDRRGTGGTVVYSSRVHRVALLVIALVVLLAGCGSDGEEQSAARDFHPVAGTFEPDDTEIADCKGDAQCLEQAFGNLAYHQGPKEALPLFDRLMREDRGVEADCHRIAHTIGSAALARNEGNVARTFAEGSASCWSGYYHGILERAFADVETRAELGQVARTLCEDTDIRANTYLAYQCVHGLGHGLMIQTGYAMPVALDVCDRLATDWDRTSCSGGVFMENISSSYGFRSPWLKDDDLVYPCNAHVVQEDFKTYCYLMVTSRILQENGYNWRQAAKTCAGVARAWVATCFQSYGRDASGFTRQNPPRILELCRIAGRAGQTDCIYGAARDMSSNYAGGREASRLCKLAPRNERARCFEGIGTILGSLHAAEQDRRNACAELTKRYVTPCLRGAGVPV